MKFPWLRSKGEVEREQNETAKTVARMKQAMRELKLTLQEAESVAQGGNGK